MNKNKNLLQSRIIIFNPRLTKNGFNNKLSSFPICTLPHSRIYSKTKSSAAESLWRNRLARSAVNRKVGGSSPPRDDIFF